MTRAWLSCATACALIVASTLSASALPRSDLAQVPADRNIVRVADGCGPQRYRGPGGFCHPFWWPPQPQGYFGPYGGGTAWNGCPPGFWRGPWGHCRDTPYHGRLPGGQWQ